ncbi:MAG: hypothetical protein JST92_22805 [Deltaproteobacteria bacterium]|nr:hypothetical protein [Deltaproteobacteria bacterium]
MAVSACSSQPVGPWQSQARIQVAGVGVTNTDCRAGFCQHDENTDLIVWKGELWFVHRTAQSQILGPNSSLHLYKSTDGGATFTEQARLLALDSTAAPPDGRDLRDPHFFVVGDALWLKAITRLPVNSTRDSNVDSRDVVSHTTDGTNWTLLTFAGEEHFSMWRVRQVGATYHSAAYEDGDKSVVHFTSSDGVNWTRGATIYDVSADTPLETELVSLDDAGASLRAQAPDGTLVGLVRMDGTDLELLGDQGRLRTKVCHSVPPYASWSCPFEIAGQRFDGPAAFFWHGRLFVLARKHLGRDGRKRTSLFELRGALGPNATAAPTVLEWGELPSAGDTAYSGVAPVAGVDGRFVTTWYSSDLGLDPHWVIGMLGATDIWRATLDLQNLPDTPPTDPSYSLGTR